MYDIIAIGSATRDVFLTSPLFKILKDSKHLRKIGFETGKAQCFELGSKIEIKPPVLTIGGGAVNTAIAFNGFGLKTAVLIKIGKDENGETILKKLKKEKIVSFAIFDKKNSTSYSAILLSLTGERTILVHRGASENLEIREIPFEKLKSFWVCISPGRIHFPVIEKIFNHFHKNKTLIAFNPSDYFIEMGAEKLKSFLTKTKILILNREEAAKLTNIDFYREKEIFKKLDELMPGIAIMTDGEKGVFVSDGDYIYQSGVFKEKFVIDRTGAGDAFVSGFVAGLIQSQTPNFSVVDSVKKSRIFDKKAIKYAIRLGSANATSVIENIGANAGILTKTGFETNRRWKYLRIKIK